MTAEEPVINGWRIGARFFERFSLRRCEMGECRAWCCGMGVWVDVDHAQKVMEHQELVKPYLPADRQDASKWFDGQVLDDPDFPSGKCTGTNTVPRPDHPVGKGCVFLRDDYLCALQKAGSENGHGRWGLKPFYCALHPLTFDTDHLVALDDDNEIYIGGGSCQRVRQEWQALPLYELMADELTLLLGADGYTELEGWVQAHHPAQPHAHHDHHAPDSGAVV